MSRKTRKAAVAATEAPVLVTETPVVALPTEQPTETPVLDPTDPDGEGGFEPTERSIVKRHYRRLYAPNDRSCGDTMARDLRDHLFPDGETLDFARLVRFAKANDCWVDSYARLNPGQVRMNVGNRLRAKVKKGHEIAWTE